MKRQKTHVEISKAVLEEMYCKQGLSRPEIAEYFGVSVKTIGNRIKEYGLHKLEGNYFTNTQDKHLSNGSVIYWSRRQDPDVPVKCGSCGRERIVLANNTTRQTFHGICRQCTNNEDWQDELSVRAAAGNIQPLPQILEMKYLRACAEVVSTLGRIQQRGRVAAPSKKVIFR